MPRGYGYGASMGAWILDFVAGWAGEWATITHSVAQYRNPALTGDATVITGEVVETKVERHPFERGRVHLAVVEVDMRTHDGAAMATARVEVDLPSD